MLRRVKRDAGLASAFTRMCRPRRHLPSWCLRSLFCDGDGDGDRKSLFVPVGVLELSVKSPSFRANVRTCILALSLEREYFSFTSSSQSCCNILFCCCYLCRSIFFHVVQILHSNIDKNTDIFISRRFEQKMSAPASDGKPK